MHEPRFFAFTDPLLVWIIGTLGVGQRITLDRSYYFGLALLLVLMLAVLVRAYREWQEIHEDLEPASPEELLQSFEQAHAAGELDEQELQRIRARLSGSAPASEEVSTDEGTQRSR